MSHPDPKRVASRHLVATQHKYYFVVLGQGPGEPSGQADKLKQAVKRLGWQKVEVHDESDK